MPDPTTHTPSPRTHIGISLVVVGIVLLHAAPILQELDGHRQTFWPFMAWGMYRQSVPSDQPVQARHWRTVAVTTHGQELDLDAPFRHGDDYVPGSPLSILRGTWTPSHSLLGLREAALLRFYWTPMRLGGDEGQTAANGLARQVNVGRTDPVVEIRVESTLFTLTPGGYDVTEQPPLVYRTSQQ